MAEYGWFVLKLVTVAAFAGVALLLLLRVVLRRGSEEERAVDGHWELKALHRRRRRVRDALRRRIDDLEGDDDSRGWRFPRWLRRRARGDSDGGATTAAKPADDDPVARRFVIDFHGDVQASGSERLAREVSVLLSIARPGDTVLLRLHSPGGVVHGYGLAAAELVRLRAAGLHLVVAVDEVAASGGYMMACVADEIVASPFAVVGSIGVVAQLPNFHRWLDRREIDFELLTAGEHKRTLTVFGENTDAGRARMQADLEDTHVLFRDFVKRHRPGLDVDRVADGSYWYGERALALGLVDRLATSESLLHDWCSEGPVFRLQRTGPRSFSERLQDAFGVLFRATRQARDEAAMPRAGGDRFLR